MTDTTTAAEHLTSTFVSATTTYMIALGHTTGLFDAAAAGPITSNELAARADLSERHVREWLGSIVTAGMMSYAPEHGTYRLLPDYAELLTGDTAMNQATMAPMLVHLAKHVDAVGGCFRSGQGLPYSAYRPEFTNVMDEVGRRTYDAALLDLYLPTIAGLIERLDNGATVVDLGCGTGHCINLMARRFPRSTFVGWDFATDAIDRARAEADDWGLANPRFEVRDVAESTNETFDVVTAFDAIHDQADPAGVLEAAHAALEADGVFFMVDVRASSNLEDNVDNPLAPMIYAVSVLHCMEVSLAEGGAGLGTAWGEQLACKMLAEAGFVDVEVHELELDPFNFVYGARKAALAS